MFANSTNNKCMVLLNNFALNFFSGVKKKKKTA